MPHHFFVRIRRQVQGGTTVRVALLSATGRAGDAIGNQLVEKLAFFLDRSADVRVFVEDDRWLHPALRPHVAVGRNPAETRRFLASADLVIAEYGHHYSLLDHLPTLTGGRPRIVLDYHGVTPEEFGGPNHREVLRQGARQRGLVWCADAAMVHSRFTRRELLEATGFPPERVAQLDNFVDTEWFCPGVPSRSLRAELGLEQATLLLFVGRVAPNKRVSLLIEALARLREPAIHAVVIGDDTDIYRAERQRCEERAAELGVADRLHFLGHVDAVRLRDAYRSADLFVMPSRHEGFCVPVREAMACGLPVIAARAGALPETVGAAGLTFVPDDADDLARQIQRVLPVKRPEDREAGQPEDKSPASCLSVAIIAGRYGREIIGGIDNSLRIMAKALRRAGHRVEILATCAPVESSWGGQATEGTEIVEGIRIRRFRLDTSDTDRYLAARQAIDQVGGKVSPEVETDYLANAAASSRLLAALRGESFDAVLVGPYLTGLTFEVAREFGEKTLLAPCFHDEPLARLESLRAVYRNVGGILYHSVEEQQFAEIELGINHPRSLVCGSWIGGEDRGDPQRGRERVGGRYVLYAGRYSPHKNLPLLLDWARRYSEERPGRFTFAFCGQGELVLPRADGLRDLGCLDRATQMDVMAGADVLVQLSRLESLSLVALEAWARAVPVLANADCAVLAGLIERGGGGQTVAAYEQFAAALDNLWQHPSRWQEMGRQGQVHVQAHYGSGENFTQRLVEAVGDLARPLAERMRERGRQTAKPHGRDAWRERFAALVEQWLDAPPRTLRERIEVEPRVSLREVSAGAGAVLLPTHVHNRGSHAIVPDGPARVVLRAEIVGSDVPVRETALPAILVPGQTQSLAALIPVPEQPGDYSIRLQAVRPQENVSLGNPAEVRLSVGATTRSAAAMSAHLQTLLTEAAALQRLPDDYLDVTEGWFAGWKHWLKRKLLHNFRRAYVDVLSRRQSAFNRQVLTALHEMAETCAALENAMNQREKHLAALQKSTAEPTLPQSVGQREEIES